MLWSSISSCLKRPASCLRKEQTPVSLYHYRDTFKPLWLHRALLGLNICKSACRMCQIKPCVSLIKVSATWVGLKGKNLFILKEALTNTLGTVKCNYCSLQDFGLKILQTGCYSNKSLSIVYFYAVIISKPASDTTVKDLIPFPL